MLQGKANKTISSLAVLPVGDDLTGGGTVGICGGEGRKELERGGVERYTGNVRINHG